MLVCEGYDLRFWVILVLEILCHLMLGPLLGEDFLTNIVFGDMPFVLIEEEPGFLLEGLMKCEHFIL